MANGLYKRGEVWYSKVTGADGKVIRKRLSKDLRAARAMVAGMLRDIAAQKAGLMPVGKAARLHLLIDIRKRYEEQARARGLSRSWFKTLDVSWRLIVDALGWKKVEDVNLSAVEGWAIEKAEQLRGQTINHNVGTLVSLFKWARDADFIERNPLALWKGAKRSEPEYRRDLTREEVRRLIDREPDAERRTLWTVLAYTALRVTAAASLRWEWLDFSSKTLSLPVEANKSGRTHRLPLHDSLIAALLAWRGEKSKTGPVFPYLSKTTSLADFFKAAARRAGMDVVGVSPHSLRHTAATLVYEATGRNLKATQEFLGHANVTTTSRYIHVSDAEKREGLKGLDFGV